MTKEEFVMKYYPYARKAETLKGVPAIFALAQSALETGWGKHAPGNMLFGIKKGSGRNYGGWNGDTQLITTTEYSSSPNRSFPVILPGYPVISNSGKWKYRIKDFFRAYGSPLGSFLDWAGLLTGNSRYSRALAFKKEPYKFAREVVNGGYATDPNYYDKVSSIMGEVEVIVQNKGLNKPTGTLKAVKIIMLLGIVAGIGILTYVGLSSKK